MNTQQKTIIDTRSEESQKKGEKNRERIIRVDKTAEKRWRRNSKLRYVMTRRDYRNSSKKKISGGSRPVRDIGTSSINRSSVICKSIQAEGW